MHVPALVAALVGLGVTCTTVGVGGAVGGAVTAVGVVGGEVATPQLFGSTTT